VREPSASAALLADGGAAASEDHFFRSPQFLGAEGATHTLCIESPAGVLAAPLIARDDLPGDHRDAISPYGYPGLAVKGPDLPAGGLAPAEIDFGAVGLVTVFIRHALGPPPPLGGATPRNPVFLADPALPRKSRMSDRQQVRRNERAGYEVSIVPGPQTKEADRAAFHTAYTETMVRAAAAERYMYDAAYFDALLAAPSTWLATARTGGGEPAAASILARSDGVLHYHLSGTGDAHLRDSPMKNVVFALVDFGEEQETPLNLGGGVTAGDRLEEFKRGFANREERLFTSELVCDPAAYGELSAGVEAGGFFPAYRAPGAGPG
jgi:hypothetical protein